jgi:hypothetical protein
VPSRGFSRAINTDRQIAALNYASKLAARHLSVNRRAAFAAGAEPRLQPRNQHRPPDRRAELRE